MQFRNSKGLKPQLLKYTALLMGICYLLNPLQQQVFDAIHVISHSLELPDNILSHEVSHSENPRAHESPDHYADIPNHDHEFIDLVKTVLEASDEDDQTQNENIVQVKYDKHLASRKLVVLNPPVALDSNGYPLYNKKLKIGFFKKWEEPPQNKLC